MKMKAIQALAVIASLFVNVAHAEAPNYNYTEINYLNSQFSLARSPNYTWYQDGYQIDASYAIENRVLLAASFSDVTGEKDVNEPNELRSRTGLIRYGYVFYPFSTLSLDVSVQWRWDNHKAPITNNDGPGAALGLRWNIAMFELYARGARLGGDFDGGYSAKGGALWNITDHFALSAGYAYTDYRSKAANAIYETRNANVGVRFNFPNQ